MLLPIYAYGEPVLRKKAEPITADYPGLQELIDNMFETMYYKGIGVGLAAPQIGKSIRLFVVDGSPYDDEDEALTGFKKVFINATITESRGEVLKMNEGCLSIPNIRESIPRPDTIDIEYYDRDWKLYRETYSGIAARIIQHEYDHIEGLLFTDRISPLRRRLLEKRLADVSRGNVDVEYKMKFPLKK